MPYLPVYIDTDKGRTLAAARLRRRRLAGVVGEDLHCQRVGALLELVHHGVIERVLVLLEPAGQVVGHLRQGTPL